MVDGIMTVVDEYCILSTAFNGMWAISVEEVIKDRPVIGRDWNIGENVEVIIFNGVGGDCG